ncbi:MAG: hypothetical protein Q4Q07_08760 [Tissierellia bacterium]|nr:hypothetical protein [Tissierellia bacterium]
MKLEKGNKSFQLQALEYEYPSNWTLKGQGFDFDTDWLIVSLWGRDEKDEYKLEGPYLRLGELVDTYEMFIRVENGFLKEGESSFVEPNLKIKTLRKSESVVLSLSFKDDKINFRIEEELSLKEFRECIESLESEIHKCSTFE